jgi:hypothetical protein
VLGNSQNNLPGKWPGQRAKSRGQRAESQEPEEKRIRVTLQPSETNSQRSASCVKQGEIREPGRQEFRKTSFSCFPGFLIALFLELAEVLRIRIFSGSWLSALRSFHGRFMISFELP